MTITPQHTQVLIQALSMAAQVAGQRLSAETQRQEMQVSVLRMEQELALFEAKANVLRDLMGALIERRLDAVKSGFADVLSMYVEQARHYMAQQSRIVDAELTTTDPLQSARFRKRMGEIDIELRGIRVAAGQVYTQMNDVILRLGGETLVFSPDIRTILELGGPRGGPS